MGNGLKSLLPLIEEFSMPFYEYKCNQCGYFFEVRQSMKDEPLSTCPRCQGSVQRLISAPGINTKNFSSPTAAKFARYSDKDLRHLDLEPVKRSPDPLAPPPLTPKRQEL
jgi:putative FmdB family regulatory protein